MTERRDEQRIPVLDGSGLRGTGAAPTLSHRLETDPDSVERDLVRLVLTLVELLRQLMERQALRRVDAGGLSEEQVERLGLALMRLEEAMAELRERFGIAATTSTSTSARSAPCCRPTEPTEPTQPRPGPT